MPSPLLRALRHRKLDLLSDLDRVHTLVDAGAGHAFGELRRFRIRLMEHLALENATICPALTRTARIRPDLARLLGDHLQDLAALQGAACGFFERCGREEGLDDYLRREFAELAKAVRVRIDREEGLIRLVMESLWQEEATLN
jgi:hypothetical protein